ncbi:hypothetical protein B0T24DRAFT_233770 [Lasiosphaeria ovina]|uniref:Uncharacterized protein n=1 Tax=Lasiosphaeria ovina TaxID=92902 RepID=A0AAE0NBA0_9PEZI|nr:hypothetical protein B0T24DRAFT_233770 [Lasiosphaeria ovina]
MATMLRRKLHLAVGLMALGATTAANADSTTDAVPTTLVTATVSTTTTWTSLDMAIPYPYTGPQFSLTVGDDDQQTTAVLSLLSRNPCGGGTDFASTTTVDLPVDCRGASTLSVSIYHGRCPLGRAGPPATVDTVTATPQTRWGFTCAPTPAPASQSSYQLADVTRTLPVPTVRADQHPTETPVALAALHHADGTCYVSLDLMPADGGSREDLSAAVSASCAAARLHPTSYAATVTSTVAFACDGCQYVRGGDMRHTCARSFSSLEPLATEVAVATATTKWAYDCLPRS